MTDREEFEATYLADDPGLTVKNSLGVYVASGVHYAWGGWQAARATPADHISQARDAWIRRIVCAANRKRFTGEVVLGLRHWDAFMRNLDAEGDPVDQGFIDNKGAFLSRTEAWEVAEAAGQIMRRVGGDETNGGTLYSENLY